MAVYNPDVVRVEIEYTIDGQTCMNVFHVSGPVVAGVPSAVTEGGMISTLNKVRSWLQSEYMPLMSEFVTAKSITLRQLAYEAGLVVSEVVNFVGGEAGQTLLPNNVAMCVSLRAATAGRAGRGRVFVAGVPRAAVIGNTFQLSWAGPVLAAWNTLLGDLQQFSPAFSHSMVIYSTRRGGVPRLVGVATPVAGCWLNDLNVDSQRRRLPGRGR